MSTINAAFAELRNYIPNFPFEKRLSKIDTLNLAIAYINMLNGILSSPLEAEDYIRECTTYAKQPNYNAPAWSTTELVARLSWIDWQKLGMRQVHF